MRYRVEGKNREAPCDADVKCECVRGWRGTSRKAWCGAYVEGGGKGTRKAYCGAYVDRGATVVRVLALSILQLPTTANNNTTVSTRDLMGIVNDERPLDPGILSAPPTSPPLRWTQEYECSCCISDCSGYISNVIAPLGSYLLLVHK